jgi:hypothetical protein
MPLRVLHLGDDDVVRSPHSASFERAVVKRAVVKDEVTNSSR